MNERELLPDFLADAFADLLGYLPPPGADGVYTLSRERHVEVEGEYADAVLGRFNGDVSASSNASSRARTGRVERSQMRGTI